MKLTINNQEWDIKVGKIKGDDFGYTDIDKMQIKINSKLKNLQVVKSTIIHELTHAYCYSLGFCSSREWSLDEEQLCEFIAMNGENLLDNARLVFNTLYEK